MACTGADSPSAPTSSCCGDNTAIGADFRYQPSAKPTNDNCCGSKTMDTGSEVPSADCCGGSSKVTACSPSSALKETETTGDACCASPSSDETPKDNCCSGPKIEETEDPTNPSCCKDKPSPCCDTSCLDRIALRECSQGKTTRSTTSPHSGCASICHPTNSQPCENHRRSAHAKYAAKLEALGCICRALLALGQESCCPPASRVRLSTDKKRRSTGSTRSMLRASTNSCCTDGSPKSERRRSECSSRGRCSSGCCGELKSSSTKPCVPTTKATWDEPTCSTGCCAGSGTYSAVAQSTSSTERSSPFRGCSKGCCSTPKANVFTDVNLSVSTEARPSDPSGCSKGCCGEPAVTSVVKKCPFPVHEVHDGMQASSKSCRSGPQASPAEIQCGFAGNGKPRGCNDCSDGCCDKPDASACASAEKSNNINACSTGCCGDPMSPCATATKQPNPPSKKIKVLPHKEPSNLEKGNTGREHIILSISGMTCTGCETKLKRTLGTLPSVKNLKTSLVLSRVEFDLDAGVQSYDEVIKHMKRTTEFKYARVTDRGSTVDVVVTDTSEFMKRDWPRGVTEMTFLNKETVSVAFDAKTIGARDLVEHGWDRPLTLCAPRGDQTLEAGNKHVRHVGYMTLISIVLTIPVLVLAWASLPEREIAYGSASLALASIVQVVIAGPFYPKALKALVFSRVIEMDLLVVLSTSAAYIFSVVSFGYSVAGQPLSTGEFFETSTLLVTLIMVGRYVAALARQKAVESISVRSLQTQSAILVDECGVGEKEVDVRLLQYGDTFKVVPDSMIPTDGTVISGSSEVNESLITGELIPVEKHPRSAVVAGSINGSGTLIVKLTRLPADNTISVIAGMVDQAKLSKPKIQAIADRIASYFVPVVVALTIITFATWITVGITVRNQTGSKAITEAITYAITVLIVSCPCAIGLAVPMVIVIASGVAAERGVIFKAADSIEVAYKASHVIFDKTGTLTQGKLTVAVEDILDSTPTSMSLLLGLIGSNKHPISTAVATHIRDKGISPTTVFNPNALTGKGVESTSPGLSLRAGNSRWLKLSSDPRVRDVLASNYTAFCFTINDSLAAVFGLEDSLRPDAPETITTLQERGISVHILSGDDYGPVKSIASQLNIPESQIRARCTPSDKQTYIQTLHSQPTSCNSTKPPITIFIGDGTNDALALATSTIGIAIHSISISSSTEVARSAADVILMRPTLSSVLTTITMSRNAVRRIKFNFAWSFVYNLFAVLLGAGAFVDARIPPQFAGLGEVVSVLPVVVAAVLLRWEGA
ncbi:E1-E2 ATPase-domain-containing protein [Aspergillus spectabilis]